MSANLEFQSDASEHKNIRQASDHELMSNFEFLVKTERKITHQVLQCILEIENRKLHLDRGYSSLFDFMVKGHGYSESAAYRRIQSARLLRQVPEISKSIESGSLSLTQVSQLSTALRQKEVKLQNMSVATKDKVQKILKTIENKNTAETRLVLTQALDWKPQKLEHAEIQKDESVNLGLNFEKSEWELMEKLRAWLSHQNPSLKWKDLLLLLAQKELKEPPQRKATPERKWVVSLKNTEKAISRRVRVEVRKAAGHQCEYRDPKSGRRCEASHFLEIDHRLPRALQGGNELQNLRLFCRSHNQKSAEDWGLFRSLKKG